MRLTTPAAYAIVVASLSAAACKDAGPLDAAPDAADASTSAPPDAAPAADAEVMIPPPAVCPRPAATPVMGDANGDGKLDVADSSALLDHVFRDGRPPACVAAADFNGDGRIEADDATRISTLLVSGAQGLRTLPQRACATAAPWPAGRCAPLAWSIEAPARSETGVVRATIAVRSATLAISGWSMSLSTEGCAVRSATTEGTPSAEIWDDPPGLRHLGYAAVRPVEGGAIAYVLLAHQDDVVLPAAERTPLLRVELEAPRPASGCASCVVRVDGARRWQGRDIAAVVVSEGRAYEPAPASAAIEVCAP